MKKSFDVVVVGGGFYGCMLALFLRKYANKTLIIEKEKNLLTKASYNNQARVHNGYHYPRSYITALRSHLNYGRFLKDFKKSIVDDFSMYYAIASNLSKTSGRKFVEFCRRIGAPVRYAHEDIKRFFNKHLVDEVFWVEEYIFNAAILRKILKEKLSHANIKIMYKSTVQKILEENNYLEVLLKDGRRVVGKKVYICTYSQINNVLKNSGLTLLPFKHEFTEMPLITVPNEFKNIGITIMDGPFFGILPFPDKNLHSLHHVRYTPHSSWSDDLKKDSWPEINSLAKKTRFMFMIKDAQRYIPVLKESEQKGSIYEVKTVLTEYEFNDRRPILFKKDWGFKNLHVVMGGKIDNIYDIIQKVESSMFK